VSHEGNNAGEEVAKFVTPRSHHFQRHGNGWCQTSSNDRRIGSMPVPIATLAHDGAKRKATRLVHLVKHHKEVAKAFETKYPGVSVEFYRAPADV
jgi:hypothetical protein